jgi:hypothetical protein
MKRHESGVKRKKGWYKKQEHGVKNRNKILKSQEGGMKETKTVENIKVVETKVIG